MRSLWLTVAAALLAVGSLAAPGTAAAKTPQAPVVMVVFDELPTHSLLGRSGRIDYVRYPNFAKLAGDSTWYANATTASDATKLAIPSILDGRAPRPGLAPTAKAHPDNLFTLLHRRGYRMKVEEEATDLCPYPECKRRFSARYFLANDRLARFRSWIDSITADKRPTVYYKHTLLPHVPWIFLPNGKRYNRNVLGPIPGLNSSELSVFDPTLVRQSWQRHLLQTGTADTLVGELIDRLKETGVYDRATVVVMADHGVSFRRGATDRRTIVKENAADIAPIPLFVKTPGQRKRRVSRNLVRTYDVLPTVAASIALRLPRGLEGRVASSRAVRRRKRVKILSRSARGPITLTRSRLLALKKKALLRKVSLFGSGRRSLFDFGPNRTLRGKTVRKLRVVEGGPVKGRLNDEDAYVTLRPEAGFLPLQVTGVITGGPPRSRRDIAVAINGVIRGVSRSVRLRRRKPEYFSVLVDPSSFVRGANAIEVLAVSRVRGRYGLRRIYGKPYEPPPKDPPNVLYPRPSDG
jgi:hypothetical protein